MSFPSRENIVLLLFTAGHAVLREKQDTSLLNPLSAKNTFAAIFLFRREKDGGQRADESLACLEEKLLQPWLNLQHPVFNSILIRGIKTHSDAFQDIKAAKVKHPHLQWWKDQSSAVNFLNANLCCSTASDVNVNGESMDTGHWLDTEHLGKRCSRP